MVAVRRSSPVRPRRRKRKRARLWWDECLAGTEGVGLAWATLLGFIRITTHRKILTRPLVVGGVFDRIESWLVLPHVHVPLPSDTHCSKLREALERLGTAGNLTTDAHLATLAIEAWIHSVLYGCRFRPLPGPPVGKSLQVGPRGMIPPHSARNRRRFCGCARVHLFGFLACTPSQTRLERSR